jgi:hypothetical protein
MSVAIDPKNLHINLLFASGSVPIPRSHPAYSGSPSPSPGPTRRLDARLLSVTLATIAGLLLIAAFSGGAAHYMLRIAESQNEVPSAIAAGIPDPPVAAPALQEPAPASVPAMAEPEPLATEVVAALPSDTVQVPLLKRPAKRVKTARLLSLARRQKPATVLDGENLALAPIDEIPPAPMLPREPILPTPKADR